MRELRVFFSSFLLLRSTALLVLLSLLFSGSAQSYTAAFYNVENLMDTLDNPNADDNDFLPQGKNAWTAARYKTKIEHLSTVIRQIGDKDGPELIGLCEVENRQVLSDLVASKNLNKQRYSIIHADSKDARGIDVALLYKSDRFKVLNWKTISASLEKIPSRTRDILLVKGILAKDTIVVLVNHWPSRRMGKEQSEPKRITMALLVREALDSLIQNKKNYPVLIMGDFNDEPADKSIKEVLQAGPDWSSMAKDGVMNPFENKQKEGQGSYLYKSDWNMLDQIMLGKGWRNGRWELTESGIFHPDWLHYKKEKTRGPFKTFQGGKYYGGYSDHFPVYIVLKERKG